jgi:hypothetical protein
MPGITGGRPSAKTTTFPEEWDEDYRRRNPAKGDEVEDFVRRHPETMSGRSVGAYFVQGLRDFYNKIRGQSDNS